MPALALADREPARGPAAVAVLIWTSGVDGLCTFFNRPRVEPVTPVIEPELGHGWADGVHPEDLAESLAVYSGAFNAREPFRMEYRLRAANGEYRWVLNTGVPRFTGSGAFAGYIGYCLDVTDKKLAELSLRDQREALAQSEKLAALGQLLAGVAHELNNPLSVVTARAELLRQLLGATPLGVHAQKVAEAAERCARIVKNFLALARRRPTRRQAADLNQVVQDSLELLAYRLRVDDVEVALTLDPDLPALWADVHQLQQVVVNLVSNAHQALRDSPAPRRLGIGSAYDPTEGRVALRVADTGPGVPLEIRARIFEPFFTTRGAGQGTGLGLSLSRSIVEDHGGTLRVDDATPHGATFVVELPRGPAPEQMLVADLPRRAPATVRGKTVLVIDDDAEVAGLLRDVLVTAGNLVEVAPNGAAALGRLGTLVPDAILCDVRMPTLDGPGFYGKLGRAHPALRPRLAFITGDELSQESREFVEGTGAPCLHKPFVLGELFQILRQLVRPARPRPAARSRPRARV